MGAWKANRGLKICLLLVAVAMFLLPVPERATAQSPVLVVFFSATGNTREVARKLAGGLSADLYEIVPEVRYSRADLNYSNPNSRTALEKENSNSRPNIAGELPDLTGVETVLIGYPIWWEDVPRIVLNFVESVDLSGRKVAVFFTSETSGLGDSMLHLQQQSRGGTWLGGKRFNAIATTAELTDWAASLGILPQK